MKAKFITLEGIEGSGKTSSLKSITDLLDKKNISYVVTREPGGSSIGKELRAILLDPETEISPEVELMLMLSDRKDHVEKIILPNLEKGNWVVSDRFMDSSIAYQGGGRQLGKKLIISLLNFLLPIQTSFVLSLLRFSPETLEKYSSVSIVALKDSCDPSKIKLVSSANCESLNS